MGTGRLRAFLYFLAVTSLFSTVFGDSLLSSLSITLCNLIHGIQAIVGFFAITLFLLGGIMYAVAHFIPTSVDFRKSMQGWASAMIIAGIVGLIVVVIAPMLVNMFGGFATAVGGGSAINTVCVP